MSFSVTEISEHHHRTAIIARNIGIELGITQNQMEILIYASLLHDIRAASNWHEKHFIVHNDDDMLVFNHNVAKVAERIALYTGFSEVESERIYIAGLLHDIGKLAVPNEILLKPGRLSEEEFDIVKQHPYYSYYILQQDEGFQDIAVWAGFHHETIDGKGYPFGLKPSEINLGSRILLTADIYSALLEDRPYREGLTHTQTIGILYDMIKNNKLDAKIVHDLTNHVDADCSLVKQNIFHDNPA